MTEHDAKLVHRVERCEFLNDLRHRQTRQGRFDVAMLHLDHPLPGTDLYLAPSDNGAGAEAVYDRAESRVPRWQILYLGAYAKLRPRGKRIHNALKEDWRSRPAARIAGVSQPTVDRWKTFFKVHFAQCHQAYRRDFAF